MNKALNILKRVLTWALVAVAVLMMIFTFVSVRTFDNADRSLFGYKMFIVLSDSMSTDGGNPDGGYFSAGDLVLSRQIDPSELKEGDIITYLSTNTENYGQFVTHKIRKLTTAADGSAGFVTYGTSTGTDDANVVTHPYVVGKYTGHIAGVGKFFQFLKTTPGYIICIFLPFLLLIIMQGLNSIKLFRRYKAEQLAAIQAEREAQLAQMAAERKLLEDERLKQQEMMDELKKLREQMAAAASDTAGQ